jgi:hypothetical protein
MAKAKKKTGKAELADGAKAIRDAEQEAAMEKVVIPKSTRSFDEILRDRVTVLPGNIGLKLDEETPIEESLRILDWTMALSDHVGFMIGDVLNFGNVKWGTKYTAALNQTNRALSTLKGYAEAARRIPVDKRVTALTFSHHREMLRLPDEKLDGVLKEVGAQAEKGNEPSIKELRFKLAKLTPRRKKTTKVTSGKGRKKARPEPPPYEPTAEEESKLDQAEEAISEAVDAVRAAKLYQIVARLDNKEKKRWMDMVEPLVTFYNAVDKVRGY